MLENTATTERRDALARALADAGIETPIDEVEALVQGVAAAAVLDRHWLRLIHPDAEAKEALAARLEALREAYAAASGRNRYSSDSRTASRRSEPNSRGGGSTASWCRSATSIRASMWRGARSAWPGSPASRARPAWRSCWPSGRRSSSTGVIPCRRRRKWTAPFTSIATSPTSLPTRGCVATYRRMPRSATIPGCTARTAATGLRRRARPLARVSSHARTTPSTRCGATNRRRRLAPLAPTRCASRASKLARSGKQSPPGSQRRVPPPRC